MPDEYGGVEVDQPQTDEWGGIAVLEEPQKPKGTFLPETSKEPDARVMGMGEPLITLPRLEGSDPRLQAFISGITGQPPARATADTAAAAVNVAKGLPEFLSSPIGIATAPIAAAGGIPARLLGLGFAGQMGLQVPESAREAGRLSVEGTPQEGKEALLGLGSNIVLPALLGGAALGRPLRPRVTPPGVQEVSPSFTRTELPSEEPRAGAQVPVTPEQVTPGAPEALPVELQATEQARLAKELGQEEQPAKAKLTPADLEPGLMVGDKPLTGGEDHGAIRNKALVEANTPEQVDTILAADKDDSKHVFVDKSGNVLTRNQAADALGEKEPLQSSRLRELQKTVPATPEPTAAAEQVLANVLAELPEGIRKEIRITGIKTGVPFPSHMEGSGGTIKGKNVLIEEGEPLSHDTVLHEVIHDYVLQHPELVDPNDYSGMEKAVDRIHSALISKRRITPVGMGAAVAPEFENNPVTPTGIRNAIVDKERVKRGLPEAMQATKRSFGEVWDKAMAVIDQDPTVQDALIDELRTKPRALTDQEDALILHRQIDLQNEYGKATRDLAQAYDDGRLEDVEREKLRVAGYADKLFDLYNIGKTSGTETARGLSARRMMANEDFSLANMLNEKRAAQGGTPLSEVQRAEVEALHKKIAALEKKVEDLRKRQEAKRESDKNGGGKPPTRPPALDPEEQQVNAANQRAKEGWKEALARDRLRIRSPLEKTQDALVKWRRAFVLSSPITLAKLTSAAIERMAFTPLEEAIGSGIGRVIPGVAEKARREGGINARAEAKAITEGFTKGMLDSWDVLRTGRSTLDALYGRAAGYPPGVSDFFGHVHGALKSVTKRNEFARSFEKRAAHAISQGVDVTDPLVQSSMAIEAYKDANRSIFQQDNRVISAYKAALRTLEQKSAETGRVPLGSKAVATTGKLLLPVVRIPTNIVAETLQTATGLATGSARLGRAFYKGIENLSPQEADIIMRSLKKGSIGAAVLALGYLNADVIGGYYQPGARKAGEQGFGTVKLYGHEIPSYLLHNPLLETLQIGATLRKVAESKFKKKEKDEKGLGWGTVGAGMGVLEEVPFLRESMEIAKSLNPTEQRSFFGELFKSLTVPQGVQWWATYRDTDKFGKPIQRKPTTLLEHEESGIPGLRELVPEKKQPKK